MSASSLCVLTWNAFVVPGEGEKSKSEGEEKRSGEEGRVSSIEEQHSRIQRFPPIRREGTTSHARVLGVPRVAPGCSKSWQTELRRRACRGR